MSQDRLLQAPTLARRLTGFSVVLFGLAYICPTVVISTFGLLMTATEGAPHWAYILATLAMLCTAVSYARMARYYSAAGSAYTYVSNTVNPLAGFLTGWILLLDYFFVPMVICLFTAKAVEVIVPGISYHIWVAVIALATTTINVLGIKLADRVNFVIMAAQLLVVGALIVMCLSYLSETPSHAVAFDVTRTPIMLRALMSGAAIAAYSFLGFDSVTTLSEEALQPTASVPRAVIWVAGASGAVYIITSYLLARVHPSASFNNIDNAGYEVVKSISGVSFVAIVVVILVAYAASAMCAQAGSARLLYAMAKGGSLPPLFGHINARFRTPVFNICLTGVVMLAAEWLNVDTAAACVNFGAFTAFLAVDACVLWDHFTYRRLSGGIGKLLIAGSGVLAMAWLLVSLHLAAIILGVCWLATGVLYARSRRGVSTVGNL